MSQSSVSIIHDQEPTVAWTYVMDGVHVVPPPPRFNYAGICRYCLTYDCRTERCVQTHARTTWMVCQTCQGIGVVGVDGEAVTADTAGHTKACPWCDTSGVNEWF